MDIRTFELGLRIKWQLPNSFSVGDYHVTFYATSTVRDLLDELLALKKWSGDYWLTEQSLAFHEPTRHATFEVRFKGPVPEQVWSFNGLTATERPGAPTQANQLTVTSGGMAQATMRDLHGGLFAGMAWGWNTEEMFGSEPTPASA